MGLATALCQLPVGRKCSPTIILVTSGHTTTSLSFLRNRRKLVHLRPAFLSSEAKFYAARLVEAHRCFGFWILVVLLAYMLCRVPIAGIMGTLQPIAVVVRTQYRLIGQLHGDGYGYRGQARATG